MDAPGEPVLTQRVEGNRPKAVRWLHPVERGQVGQDVRDLALAAAAVPLGGVTTVKAHDVDDQGLIGLGVLEDVHAAAVGEPLADRAVVVGLNFGRRFVRVRPPLPERYVLSAAVGLGEADAADRGAVSVDEPGYTLGTLNPGGRPMRKMIAVVILLAASLALAGDVPDGVPAWLTQSRERYHAAVERAREQYERRVEAAKAGYLRDLQRAKAAAARDGELEVVEWVEGEADGLGSDTVALDGVWLRFIPTQPDKEPTLLEFYSDGRVSVVRGRSSFQSWKATGDRLTFNDKWSFKKVETVYVAKIDGNTQIVIPQN